MKIKPILAPLALLAFAGCGAQTPATPTAPAAVDSTAPAANNSAAAKPMDAKPLDNKKPQPTATLMNARDMKPDLKNYRVRGQVKGVEKSAPDGRMTLNVSHENIPGFMPAMEMRVPFAKNEDAAKVKVGDKIAFDMNRSTLDVSNIEKLPPATKLALK